MFLYWVNFSLLSVFGFFYRASISQIPQRSALTIWLPGGIVSLWSLLSLFFLSGSLFSSSAFLKTYFFSWGFSHWQCFWMIHPTEIFYKYLKHIILQQRELWTYWRLYLPSAECCSRISLRCWTKNLFSAKTHYWQFLH